VVRLAHAERPGGPTRSRERVEAAVRVESFEQIEQHRQEIDPRPVDLDAQLQAEPVRRRVAGLEARIPGRLLLDDAERVARIDLHAPSERAP
jgi:hypothetical protein